MNPTSAGYDGGVEDAIAAGAAGPTWGIDVDDNNQPGGASGSWATNPVNPSNWSIGANIPGWLPYAVGAGLAVLAIVLLKEFL
jgi:hypothetical protein